MNILLVSLQALDDSCVGLQTTLPQLIQVVNHVVVRLNTDTQQHKLQIIILLQTNKWQKIQVKQLHVCIAHMGGKTVSKQGGCRIISISVSNKSIYFSEMSTWPRAWLFVFTACVFMLGVSACVYMQWNVKEKLNRSEVFPLTCPTRPG